MLIEHGRLARMRLCVRSCLGAILALASLAAACSRGEPLPRERELTAVIDSILPRIAELAALEVRRPVELEVRSRSAVRAFVEERLSEEYPAEVLEGLRLTYVTLGLIADTLDLRALLLDLYTEQVIGYYDPRTRRLYIVEGVARSALRPVLVHELVHALQDQHADLDSLVSRERGNDRQTAAHAALEGHAMLVMFAYLAEAASGIPVEPELLPNPAEQLEQSFEEGGDEFGVFERAPPIVRRALLFPYVAGAGFVHQLWLYRSPAEPRRAPLGDLLPQSTQQVMHPRERFITTRDAPLEIRYADTRDWRVRYEDTLGEFEIGVWLEEHLGTGAAVAAEDWRGDRFRLIEGEDGGIALVWHTIWDQPSTADRFATAARRIAALNERVRYAIDRVELEGRAGVRVVIRRDGGDPATVPPGTARIVDLQP
jgi:hypothetical protein